MNKKLLFVMTALFLLLSCKKDPGENPNEPGNEDLSTAVGLPIGNASIKTIGTAGGELTSADGVVKIIIPAGALAGDKQVSIQPVTKQLPSALSNAYRLSPHGEQFSKPVTIIFNYKEEDLEGTIPEFLDIAYQDDKGVWQAMTNTVVDKATKQIKVNTTHFSDWTYFKSLKLDPSEATVDLGGSVDLKLTTPLIYIDPDLLTPGSTIPVNTGPRELRPDEIIGWNYSGDGILVSQAAKAFYTAPQQEPELNPEAVSVEINIAKKGQFMLVSNITVVADKNVQYLHVDEDWMQPQNNNKTALYIYGNFGVDPGAPKRSVSINGTSVTVDIWAPNFIRCFIDEFIHGPVEIKSNNNIVATTILKKFTGKILYERFHGGILNSGSSNALKETTEIELVYRGFGKPCPPGITPFEFPGSLAMATMAKYKLQGSASVTTPGPCAKTTSVTLPTVTDFVSIDPPSFFSLSGLKAETSETTDGITVNFSYLVLEVIKNVKIRSANCISSSEDIQHIGVGLTGFEHQPLEFEFVGNSGLRLKANELRSELMASGILTGAWDGTGSPSHYELDGLMRAVLRRVE